MQYGVRRLILINSGNYGYAEVDLAHSVHLAAPNNRGKSTLVNALQFLYINDMRNMKFANTIDETARHYFGGSPSYLVFECATPIGLKCLLIRGLSRLQAGKYERYIFDGGYNRADFVENEGRIREFPFVQELLAGRHFKSVAHNALWKVLSGEAVGKSDESGGLKILPIRHQEDYRNFCRVYQKLLTLADLDSDALRELLIACHSRDVGEARIDIATDYRDQFELAEHTDADLVFVESAAALIDEGRTVRNAIAVRRDSLANDIPRVWNRAQQCVARLRTIENKWEEQTNFLTGEKVDKEADRNRLLISKGKCEERLQQLDNRKKEIQDQHDVWNSYTEVLIGTVRQNAESLRDHIRQLAMELSQAEKYDLRTLERRVKETERQIEGDTRVVEEWDKTFAAFLLKEGIKPPQLDAVFRLINASAHSAIIGDGLELKNEAAVLARIRALLVQTDSLCYTDDDLAIDLNRHESIDLETLCDPRRMRSKILLATDELIRMKSQLETGKNQQAAHERLATDRTRLQKMDSDIEGYNKYVEAIATLPEIEAKKADANNDLSRDEDNLKEVYAAIEQLSSDLERGSKMRIRCQIAAKEIKDEFEKLHAEIRDIGLDSEIIPLIITEIAGTPESDIDATDSWIVEAGDITSQARALLNDAKSLRSGTSAIKELQDKIAIVSRDFPGQQVFFADADQEWESLIQHVDSIDELRDAAKQAWDDLFTTLSGRLNGLLLGVREIQNAVRRLNASIQSFQVSNLQSVDLKVSTDNSTYQVIAELCSEDGLFQNKDELENAKKHLRNWIAGGKEISLESLFSLQISGVQSDGTPIHANSLDRIGSTGTGITIKAMILTNLIRAIAPDARYHLHFFIDETGRLDDLNLAATTRMAVSQSIIPITAEPKVKLEALAHPEVTVYTLDQGADKLFKISTRHSFRARRTTDDALAERPVH